MRPSLSRRQLLGHAALAPLATQLLNVPANAQTAEKLKLGPAQPFSFEGLIDHARALASQPYVPPPRPDPEVVAQIDYDAYGKIRFKPEYALYADGPSVYPITFMLVGMYFPKTVRMYKVGDGQAREILYSPDYFSMPADHVARKLAPEPSAFAGFWVRESRLEGDWAKREPWATYVGASYWRAVGELGQVGMSSRGVAIGTGDPKPEEFPDFVAHWFEPAATENDPVIVHSLLDGPSISGAYRFALHRGKGVTIDVENHLFLRADVEHLGIAPLTSMFWFAEYDKRYREDWRPEVHDADGLALWTGSGERIWRPLNDPPRIITSSFLDDNPKGFGLSQRDRNFEHYLDGVGYDKRPSVWIEPVGDWGKGSVQLVEIPTDDEIYDNINAFWVPAEPAKAGVDFGFKYRQHWVDKEPFFPADLARCVATRVGRGGEAGKPRPKGVEKFVVEFAGGDLPKLDKDQKPEAVITSSRGTIGGLIMVERVPTTERWRAMFDLSADGPDPAELRLFLQLDGRPLTETWLYQYLPAPGA